MRIDLSSDATNSYSEYQHSKLPASFLGLIPLCAGLEAAAEVNHTSLCGA